MIPATAAADAESQHHQQQQQQQQQPVSESPSVIDYYSSDWTGNRDGVASDEAEHIRDKLIDGQALVDDATDVDRQVPCQPCASRCSTAGCHVTSSTGCKQQHITH